MKNTKKYKIFLYLFFIFVVPIFLSHPINAATYYIAPDANLDGSTPPAVDGSDTNPGTEQQPWKNFTKAWQVMIPGDTLYLLDGIYYQTLQPTVGGTAGNYVIIKAKDDGQYQRIPVQLGSWGGDPGGFYNDVEGIVARNSKDVVGEKDGAVYNIQGSNNILRRVSGYNANINGNAHVFSVAYGTNNLIEDCIAAGSGRKMAFAYAANGITFRRCYAYWQEWNGRHQAGTEWPWGNAFEMYNSSDGTIENVIAYGAYYDAGLNILSNVTETQSPNPSNNNKILGSMMIRNGVYKDGSIWHYGRTRPQPADGNILRLWWQWPNVRGGVHIGTWGPTAVVDNALFQDIFSWQGMELGLNINAGNGASYPTNTTINRATVLNNRQDAAVPDHYDGPRGTDVVMDEFSGINVTNSRIGQGYDRSTGQVISNPFTGEGARLTNRYIDGNLMDGSNGQPAQNLWPWSMQDRLIKETGIDVTGETTDILVDQGVPTGKQYKAPDISPVPPWGSPLKNKWGVTYLSSPLTVSMTPPGNAPGGSVIRYTLDETVPTNTSPQYAGPFTIATSTKIEKMVKAAMFDASGNQISHIRSAYYKIDTAKQNEAPEVMAGAEPFLTSSVETVLPKNQVHLTATAEDYTFPSGSSALQTTWSQVNGPGTVTFSDTDQNASVLRPVASFSSAGLYTLELAVSDGSMTTTKDVDIRVWPNDLAGVVHDIPGRIEAEDYKSGKEGSGYHQVHHYGDTLYRGPSDVDITYAYNDYTGYAISDINGGEWWAYDVNVTQARSYALNIRVAGASAGGVIHLDLDGTDITGPITIDKNGTGSFRKWNTITVQTPVLSQGTHTLKIMAHPEITNVVTTSSGSYVVQTGLKAGTSLAYTDSTAKYTSIPSNTNTTTYIQTAQSDVSTTGNTLLTFTLTQPRTVYVAHDVRITQKPSWLSTFTPVVDSSGNPIQIITTDTTFDLYQFSYPAGDVVLGGNGGIANTSMYLVIVKRADLGAAINYIEFTTPSSTTPGDLNNDNTVNIQDIIILINEIFTPSGVGGSDINNDGKVDILDVIALINIIFA